MFYKFRCQKCKKLHQVDIKMADYDKEKDNQVCPDCNGRGRWKTDYVPEYDHWEGKMGGYWNYKECERCHGKGWLEKKVTWE